MVTLTLTAGAVCLLISAVELQGLTVQTENSRINVTVGDNAFFSVLPSVPTISITWNFGTTLIGQWTIGIPIINDKYRTRVEYFPQNGSLLLMSVTVSDSGEYTVTVLTGDAGQAKATITLHVLVELQGLTVQTENSRINVTVGDNAFFSVLPSVPTISITWNFGTTLIGQWTIGIPIINDKYRTRVEYFPQNGSLLLMSVTVSDSGEYTVTVLTGDAGQAKATITLHVLDGPDLPTVSINPDLPVYIAGRTVTFTCSTDWSPTAELEWYLNDTSLPQKGQQLIIASFTLNDTGMYTGQALNNLTKSYSASTKQIAVIERVSNVTVSANNANPVENMDTILLTCHASGFVQSRIWFKNNRAIQDNDRIKTSPDNVTLTIISVNRNDSATYKCNASNDFSSDSGDIILQINYGPKNVVITPTGPVWVELGESLTLHCSAQSVPDGQYEWYNGSSLLNKGQTYNIASISSNHGGNYTCQVDNTITKKGSNASIQVIVTDQTSRDNNMSSGAIAGIVIAAILTVGLISGISAWSVKRKAGGMSGQAQGQNDANISSPVNVNSVTIGETSAGTYENIPRKQKERATEPLDENSTYMGLQLQDQSVYSDLMRR
uniref:cell adhesion molecule CEACAM5-like isoform X1 n=1 Tax=Pristiophorus japonicus TaxID=55135 RepID=UPI00398F84D0